MDDEFKELFDLNKILYAKAEHLKSRKNGRVLPMFRLEINDPTEVEALISQKLGFQVTGIVYEVEEFRSPASVKQCYNIRLKHVGRNKNVSSAVRAILTKDARTEKPGNQNVPTVRGHMSHHTKSVQNTKKNKQHLVNNRKTYA